METRARYALIGLFMLAVILASFAFVYWLENKGGLGQRDYYRVRFDGSISGLLVGSAVLFNGIRVGEVSDLGLDPEHPERAMATIGVEHGTPVRADTEVGIESQGLTGGAAVTLMGGDAASPAVTADGGEKLPLLTAEPGATQDWTSLARTVLRKLDTILTDNADNFHSAVANFNTFTDVLAKNSDRIDGILGGIERMTGGGGAAKTNIPVYDLTAAKDFPPLAETASWQLVVPEPTALLAVNSDKIKLRPSATGETTDIGDARWADNAPILLQEKIIQTFENAGYSKSVSRPRDGFEAGYQLLLDIRVFSLSTSGSPLGEIEFEAKVLGPDGKIVAAKTFKDEAPASGTDAPAAAAALSEAFDKAAAALVPWTVETINSAPPPPAPSPTEAEPAAPPPPTDAEPGTPSPPEPEAPPQRS
jgi:phospholipid/cholesterol/gamma-HCH transport system substrate-binding protein